MEKKKEPVSLSIASLTSSEEIQALKCVPSLLKPKLLSCFGVLNCDKWFISRSLLMFTMENCFYVLISQAVRYLKDPVIVPRDKQRLKQELSSELVRPQFLFALI